jgi:hypothetical protein
MENNLVILSQFKNEDDIYPAEQMILCSAHYNEKKENNNYQINTVKSSMPDVWCEACNPAN